MVRAILSDSKTQTRRVAKLTAAGHVKEVGGHRRWHTGDVDAALACPYGQPGDRLWVRETFVQGFERDPVTDMPLLCDDDGNDLAMKTWYRATAPELMWSDDDGFITNVPWEPSIHMPRAASRITLEITGVRVERLHKISEDDAVAEGVNNSLHLPGGRFANENFAHLWCCINGDDSWEANPWVWVVEFKRLEGGAS
jgi:hypothetical protein